MKKFSIILLFIVAFFCTNSCKKIQNNKITGTWNLVALAAWQESYDVTWTFYEGNKFIKTIVDNNTLTTTSDTGTYKITVQSFKTYFDLYDIDEWDAGHYLVDKLRSKKMIIIQTANGNGTECYNWKEFTKQK